MSILEALMLVSGGLFAGGATTFAWSRVPIWRGMPAPVFVEDFSKTLRRTDKVQPALLVAAIAASVAFAVTGDGAGRMLALIGAAAFAAVLIASATVMVPLQRRIIAGARSETFADLQQRWFRGNLGRSALSVAAFVATALASSAG